MDWYYLFLAPGDQLESDANLRLMIYARHILIPYQLQSAKSLGVGPHLKYLQYNNEIWLHNRK